jgi:hypothetical protein
MGDAMSKTETTDSLTINYMHKLRAWRMAFFGVVILLAGIVIGGASMMILAPDKLMKPPRGREFGHMWMLRRDLGLSPEQSEKIKPILDSHMEALHEIRTDALSEIDKALVQMNEDISDILTEQQKRIWQRSLDRLERELYPGGPRRGEGPRGPGFRGGPQERFGRGRQERSRGGPGPFGPPRPPAGPNFPRGGMHRDTRDANDKPPNEDL